MPSIALVALLVDKACNYSAGITAVYGSIERDNFVLLVFNFPLSSDNANSCNYICSQLLSCKRMESVKLWRFVAVAICI